MTTPFKYIILSLLFVNVVFSKTIARTNSFRCTWRSDPATTMVVGWNQVSGHSPILYYSTTDFGNNASAYQYSHTIDRKVQAKGMNNHFVRLTGLIPNTVYYFMIKDSEGVSQSYSFKTASDSPYDRLSIIAGGDSRYHRSGRQDANRLVAKLRPHFVFFGGDMTGGDTAREWREWFDDWQLTFSSERRITPIIPTRGNHEYSNRTIVDLFDVPSNNVYYALSFGGNLLRAYTLNSLIATGGHQKTWLQNDLESHPQVQWKIAQYHYPMRPHTRVKKDRNTQRANWAPLFYNHQVNLVVESDGHVVKTTYPIRPFSGAGSNAGFIRDDENGTVFIGEGCWGAPLRRNNDDKAWTRNSGSFNQFKWIFIDQNKIEIRTIKTANAHQVASVDPNNIFEIPAGLNIWNPSNGSVITIGQKASSDFAMFDWTSKTNMEVVNFIAEEKEKEVAIKWSTRNEVASVRFDIQRSEDGQNFTTISSLIGKGQSSKGNDYIVNDSKFGFQDYIYRMKRVLSNGIISYFAPSKKTSSKVSEWKTASKIETNPDTGVLKVSYKLKEAGNVSIKMLSVDQKEVSNELYNNQKKGNYIRSIDMKRIPEGQYLLVIKKGQEIISRFQVTHGD